MLETSPGFLTRTVLERFFSGVLYVMRKKVFSDPELDKMPVSGTAKRLAWASLICWFGAICAGRLLAYLRWF